MGKIKDSLIDRMNDRLDPMFEFPNRPPGTELNDYIGDGSASNTQRVNNIEAIAMAHNLIDRLMDIIQEVADKHGLDYYYQTDDILYADRWLCLVNNEIDPELLDDDIRNLRLFTKNV